ncbi:DUF5937 family protein [Streptomyces longwoodensis]|uniref:ArsR/SmtB family transcription factor n=1 Tax=Streptomyces longwoodensis TaxID=68231 RepID=UPI0036ED098C
MTLRIDIGGLPSERVRFVASPLAELTAMLHVLAEPGHHPQLAGWAGEVWAGLPPELAEPEPSEPVPLETVTRRLEALSHPVRLRLLRTLARGPHTTGELAHAWELSPPEVSRHLAVLRRAGLLTGRRDGRYVRYRLNPTELAALGTDLLAAVLR